VLSQVCDRLQSKLEPPLFKLGMTSMRAESAGYASKARSNGQAVASQPNFRCLGGLGVDGGQIVRHGIFFRAPAVTTLSAEEERSVAALGLALIIDFRQIPEAAAAPVHLPSRRDAKRLALPVKPSRAKQLLANRDALPFDPAAATHMMTEVYRDFVRDNIDTFASFLIETAAAPGPVLFHCTAGKDRTGLAAALVLAALGADRATIMADFLITADLWNPPAELVASVPESARAAILGVQPAYLDAAFDVLNRQHGGAVGFARRVLGDAGLQAWFRRSTTHPNTSPQETT